MLGTDWRQTLYSLQAVLFAGAYPAIFLIGRLLFGLQRRQALWGVAFIGLAGGFVSYVPVILTDGLFALVLVAGVACGLMSLASSGRGWLWGGAHIGLIMYAANVRPMLAFFPVAALCAHWALLREDRWKTNLNEKKTVALIMFAVTIIGVQTPALRNWFFNGVFTPSEIGSINLYDYLAYDVLKFRGDTARYEKIERRLDQLEGPEHVQDRIELRKKEALAVFRESPGVTAGHLIYYTVLNSIETHWQNLFYLWKKTWYRDYEDGSVVWSPLPFLLATAWIVVYGNLYGIALFALLCKSKELLVMGAVIFFLIPYGFCGTSYQGARFRLWLEPFIVLFVFTIVPYYIRRYREGRMLIDGR
ncbi:MAG: hypothetical protein RBS57_14305 [Desulforhabdus sp.]|jgi:hypothetical protein|nr:hypothetical protein [Desulforhabdus sp.]